MDSTYVGRFAPSPTGPLHFGSLLAALASYLDARAHGGRWLLRIEDLDPPREPAGTDRVILSQLEAFGLHWDGEVLYQSSRHEAYRATLEALQDAGHVFRCSCTRARLRKTGGRYDGHCRKEPASASFSHAIRFNSQDQTMVFDDRVQGHCSMNADDYGGDFVVRRKDGLFAYQLAVMIDDADQGVNQVVRGIDLLDSTPRQLLLQQSLKLPTLRYAHIPIAVDEKGNKLSKQQFAEAADHTRPQPLLVKSLQALGQPVDTEMLEAEVDQLLSLAADRWDIQQVPRLATIPA